MKPLPRIMVAPNGARLTRSDHPQLPVTIPQIVDCAKQCFDAGAGGLHAHVRDREQKHVLDAGLYRELLAEMTFKVPNMAVQITTEAVGQYNPHQQRALVRKVMPTMVSVALRELLEDNDENANREFYHWTHEADIAVQHILYDSDDIAALDQMLKAKKIPSTNLQVLIVLGRYTKGQISSPASLRPLVQQVQSRTDSIDWAVCAFGQNETACLQQAFALGGKARVGFENNLRNSDGQIADHNAARVQEIASSLV